MVLIILECRTSTPHMLIYHLSTMHCLSHLHAFADTVQLGSITLRGFLILTVICFLFLPSCTLTIAFIPYAVEIFLFFMSFSTCLSLIAISLPEYYLSGSRQTKKNLDESSNASDSIDFLRLFLCCPLFVPMYALLSFL